VPGQVPRWSLAFRHNVGGPEREFGTVSNGNSPVDATHEREYLPNFGGHTANNRRGRHDTATRRLGVVRLRREEERFVKRMKGSVAWQ
jgi:hypothetical protein